MTRSFILIAITIFLTSCLDQPNKQNDRTKTESKIKCGQFKGVGNVKKAKTQFCGIVPKGKEYTYKVGEWQFWNEKEEYLGVVEFDAKIDTVDDHGGCTYYITYSDVIDTSLDLDSTLVKGLCQCEPIIL